MFYCVRRISYLREDIELVLYKIFKLFVSLKVTCKKKKLIDFFNQNVLIPQEVMLKK